tara:strand:+ start:341 stop:697 length:357 start_codon:yes stop_codon:yes gene_type:complete
MTVEGINVSIRIDAGSVSGPDPEARERMRERSQSALMRAACPDKHAAALRNASDVSIRIDAGSVSGHNLALIHTASRVSIRIDAGSVSGLTFCNILIFRAKSNRFPRMTRNFRLVRVF